MAAIQADETHEMLTAYQLKTLNPQSWESSIDNEVVTEFTHREGEDTAYDMFLEFVNRDFDLSKSGKPVDALNPSRTLQVDGIDGGDLAKLNTLSKRFNPKQFLKVVHAKDSFDQLKHGLEVLDDSLDYKNKELQQLIEREAIQFVRSKSGLDSILQQFQTGDIGKNDEGLKNLKASVNAAAKEGTLLVKPVISSKQKIIRLKQSIEFIEKKKGFFDLPKQLKTYLQDQDYDNFVHDYKQNKALKEKDNSRTISRVWEEVEEIADTYKRKLWSDLNTSDKSDDFLRSIKKLMELDVIDNPVLLWIDINTKKSTVNFIETFSRYHEKTLNLQINILSTLISPDLYNFKKFFTGNSQLLDSPIVTEVWLMLGKMWEVLKAEVLDFVAFWHHVENFMNGSYFQRLRSGYIDNNSPFLRLEDYEIEEIRAKGQDHVVQIIKKLADFFHSTHLSLNLDVKGEASLASYGFIPPFTNSLSTLKYLPGIAGNVSEMLNELGQLSITTKSIEMLRGLSLEINERIISAVCTAWVNDCHTIYRLEDWARLDSGETSLPNSILQFETHVVEKIGELLFTKLPEGKDVQIVRYPSKKILTGVQIQFLGSFDILLESMIKKVIEEIHDPKISKHLKTHHQLLTLLNIKKMSSTVVPTSIDKFDAVFETKLRSENLEIYSLLTKMEHTILDTYMGEQKKAISTILQRGIASTDWAGISSNPSKVSSFVYEALNVLVTVHTGVVSVSTELIGMIMRELVEFVSARLLEDFRNVTVFSSEGLGQVFLDVEFFKNIVGRSATNATLNNIKLIYKTILTSNVDMNHIVATNSEVLTGALGASSIEYTVFNS
ncbi:exocyst subunit SEC5 CYBJADRAFT_149483 [Cyberlindnera jadinii NRRL Y-1542]|uniref:Exocyst complex component SEC5 n=1 Tax=Cyberlindnera jadinii (strain ATCC 18201 / CBS 1600 / BCRC 20928 / JCM 3617 / NBRC 0987 / NRRL Y-1542) TaxID=983966 RepID=A0A1E4S4N4_CYBJN|nr:hypothetical protein CYBJADRAFT_149483 [Cyberlindnera jadinii NRRL Y-1542]ODV74352.1 hypothetical protein CYBJADRAFT_149483 [Cyberlindnera jadinii NRRL Y-1542]